jgi:hypothetical protein
MTNGERLRALSSALRRVGYDADDVAGCVRVRLPLWCSLTIEETADGIALIPRTGFVSREAAFRGDFVMFLVFVAMSVFIPVVGWLAASWLAVVLSDVARYVVTESAMSAVRVAMFEDLATRGRVAAETATAGRR